MYYRQVHSKQVLHFISWENHEKFFFKKKISQLLFSYSSGYRRIIVRHWSWSCKRSKSKKSSFNINSCQLTTKIKTQKFIIGLKVFSRHTYLHGTQYFFIQRNIFPVSPLVHFQVNSCFAHTFFFGSFFSFNFFLIVLTSLY